MLRSAEHEAWFRSWELIEFQSAHGATNADAGVPVTFVQLFSQPDAYRGRLVQVSGTAWLGYRVGSREQRFGIDGYHVVWLRPADAANSPIAVYLVSLPAGFPACAQRGPGSDGTVLREEITVTGVFFKRWLYGSQGGPNLAPLVLGRITQWTPPSSVPVAAAACEHGSAAVVGTGPGRRGPGPGRLGVPQQPLVAPRSGGRVAAARALPPFDERSIQPPVEESLRQMASESEPPP